MEPVRQQSSFLITRFREFYREVMLLQKLVEFTAPHTNAAEALIGSGEGGTSTVAPRGTEPAVQDVSPAMGGVWQQLLAVLERQGLEAGQTGGAFAYEVYREAQYVMAVLADEVFLHVEWEGRASWPLLESRLFQSHMAGETIFERLDRLLQRRDPFYLDLAAVYFMALSLGFQGKFRGEMDQSRLMEYRRQLFKMIYRRDPKLFAGSGPLFPQSMQHTLGNQAPKKLPAQWVWLWLVALVIAGWLLAAQGVWASATGEISCLMCRIQNSECACRLPAGVGEPAK